MGMSTHVEGFAPPDDEWRKMKAIWDACDVAGIDAPAEVSEFFNDEKPDEQGIKIDLDRHPSVSEYHGDGEGGFQVEIEKLPPQVKFIRFVNAS